MSALAKEQAYIPYRDSKLTMLLSDCLSGNSKVLMMTCVKEGAEEASETLCTLQFGARAKRVKLGEAKKNIVGKVGGEEGGEGWGVGGGSGEGGGMRSGGGGGMRSGGRGGGSSSSTQSAIRADKKKKSNNPPVPPTVLAATSGKPPSIRGKSKSKEKK